jgi:hypothetical protein
MNKNRWSGEANELSEEDKDQSARINDVQASIWRTAREHVFQLDSTTHLLWA